MARAFVDDRWLKNDEDGNPPSRAAKQSLANAKDPMKANAVSYTHLTLPTILRV